MEEVVAKVHEGYADLKAHAESLLKGFRSSVAVGEEELLHLIERIETIGGHLFTLHPKPETATAVVEDVPAQPEQPAA